MLLRFDRPSSSALGTGARSLHRRTCHHTLRRRWRDQLPAAGALWHIGVVPRGIRAIVPDRRGRLDINLGGWSDDDRRVAIWVPVRTPVRPDGHPQARPDEAMATMPEAVPAMAEAMATMPAAASPAVSTPRAGVGCAPDETEKDHEEDHDGLAHTPLLSQGCPPHTTYKEIACRRVRVVVDLPYSMQRISTAQAASHRQHGHRVRTVQRLSSTDNVR